MRRLSAAENQQLEESLKYMIGQKTTLSQISLPRISIPPGRNCREITQLMRKGIVVMDNEDIFSLSRRFNLLYHRISKLKDADMNKNLSYIAFAITALLSPSYGKGRFT